MLHGRAIERGARLVQHRLARLAVVAEDANLDELVRREARRRSRAAPAGQAVVADDDDGIEVVRLGAQRAALGGGKRVHGRSVSCQSRGRRCAKHAWRRLFTRRFASLRPWPAPSIHAARSTVRQGVDARARQRPLRAGGAAPGLPLPRRVQAPRARRSATSSCAPGMTVVDLGAAPGSWSQVLRERVGATGRDRGRRSAADGRRRRRDLRPGRLPRGRRPGGGRASARRRAGGPCGLGHGPQSLGYRPGRPGAQRASG